EVYSQADFDSDVLDEVYKDETYLISNKVYGPFYRIKLKNGKIGYIVDYEVDIEGKGRLKETDYDALEAKGLSPEAPQDDQQVDPEEQEVFGYTYHGPVLALINFHEDTMGSNQIDNLPAIGYKSISTFAWSVLVSPKAPAYYSERPGFSATGVKAWGDFGFSNDISQFPTANLRFSGNFFTHVSVLSVKSPLRNYDLQDITAGVDVELGFLKKFRTFAIDTSIKYFFDKSNYAAVGVSLLF
ncbi:MAG: SH3 domain-containing protein, partial [Pseudobdellovibrio sp.]